MPKTKDCIDYPHKRTLFFVHKTLKHDLSSANLRFNPYSYVVFIFTRFVLRINEHRHTHANEK